jgi:hypothetical protein
MIIGLPIDEVGHLDEDAWGSTDNPEVLDDMINLALTNSDSEQIGSKRRTRDNHFHHFLDISQHAHQAIRSAYGEALIAEIIELVQPTQSSKVCLQSSTYGFYRLVAARDMYYCPRRTQTVTSLGPIALCNADDPFARIIHSEGAYYSISASPYSPWLDFPRSKKRKKPNNFLSYIGATSNLEATNIKLGLNRHGLTVTLTRDIKKGEPIAYLDSFAQPYVSIRSYAEFNSRGRSNPLSLLLWSRGGKLKPASQWGPERLDSHKPPDLPELPGPHIVSTTLAPGGKTAEHFPRVTSSYLEIKKIKIRTLIIIMFSLFCLDPIVY